jgi:hypothetical protein
MFALLMVALQVGDGFIGFEKLERIGFVKLSRSTDCRGCTGRDVWLKPSAVPALDWPYLLESRTRSPLHLHARGAPLTGVFQHRRPAAQTNTEPAFGSGQLILIRDMVLNSGILWPSTVTRVPKPPPVFSNTT